MSIHAVNKQIGGTVHPIDDVSSGMVKEVQLHLFPIPLPCDLKDFCQTEEIFTGWGTGLQEQPRDPKYTGKIGTRGCC